MTPCQHPSPPSQTDSMRSTFVPILPNLPVSFSLPPLPIPLLPSLNLS